MPSLTFGYSTLANRLQYISLPEVGAHPDWDFLITVQSGSDLEVTQFELDHAPKNPRATVLSFPGVGVTKIRNQVIDNAKGEYVIFSDDDIVFDIAGVAEALEYMQANKLAMLLGQAIDENGVLRKSYPSSPTALTKFNSAKAATYETIIDVAMIRGAGVRFDEGFGAGAAINYLGDEYIFIADLINKGLKCEFVPITLAMHPIDSSGSEWGTDRDRIARAAVFDRVFQGGVALPYLVRTAFGFRKLGKGLNFKNYIKFIFKK